MTKSRLTQRGMIWRLPSANGPERTGSSPTGVALCVVIAPNACNNQTNQPSWARVAATNATNLRSGIRYLGNGCQPLRIMQSRTGSVLALETNHREIRYSPPLFIS